MGRHAQGVLLIILSAIAYSSAGFFTRLIHLDAWTMLFWRGLFAGLMILCVIVVQERGHTMAAIRAVGRPGFAAALSSTAATILYLNAFRRTSVADVAVIFAFAPFLTAGLGWLCLGVTEAWTTLAASLFGLLGVGMGALGAILLGYLGVERLLGYASLTERTATVLFGVLLVFTGLQLVTLGLLAELQARTYHESQGKPIFVVREVLDAESVE